MPPTVHIDLMASPLGVLLLAHGSGYLCAVDFQDYELRFRQVLARRFGGAVTAAPAPGSIRAPLAAYLAGEDMTAIEHIPLQATGTRLQNRIWSALREIPAGCTWSYGRVAHLIGLPGAEREVATVVAHNPLAIIVPCHRLVGSAGELISYVGGLARKRWLLAHEGLAEADSAPVATGTSLLAGARA